MHEAEFQEAESRGWEERAVLAGEAPKDRFAGGDFDESENGEGKQDQNHVREPGVQRCEVKTLENAVGVE
jgi:hypothetical protein